jgi:hypothetical protein
MAANSTSRHPGEPLADGRGTLEPQPAARRDPRTAPAPRDASPASDARVAVGEPEPSVRRRSATIRVSETDARLWFG